MDWSVFIKENLDIFLGGFFSLVGVIVGAILTSGFTFFIEYLRAKREEKLHLKRKREETYTKILQICANIVIRVKCDNICSPEELDNLNNLNMSLQIYGSKNICNKFYEIQQSLLDEPDKAQAKLEIFKDYIRKELSIKD